MMSGAFTVEQGGSPQVQVDIIGPNLVRIGREQTFLLAVRNSGNVDAGPGLVSLSVPPTIQYVQESGVDLFSAGVTSSLEYGIPSPTNNGNPTLLFATTGIPAGSSQSALVQLTLPVAAVPVSGSSFTLTAAWQQDLWNMSLDDFLGFEGIPFIPYPSSGCPSCQNSYALERMAYSSVVAPYQQIQNVKLVAGKALATFFADATITAGAFLVVTTSGATVVGGVVISAVALAMTVCVNNVINNDSCLGSLRPAIFAAVSAIRSCGSSLPESAACLQALGLPPTAVLKSPVAKALGMLQTFGDQTIQAIDTLTSVPDLLAEEAHAYDTLQKALGPYASARAAYQACLSPTQCSVPPPQPLPTNPPGTISLPVTGVTALDPNEKLGTRGAGAQQYVSGTVPLSYAVYFTNESTATAPAQHVAITDQLDLTNDSVSTFGFGPITFGSQLVFPPPGLTNYSTSLDLRPTNNLLVQVDAHLDPSTGLLTWSFASLDPATNQPPTDPTAGFLPPGGEGGVFFTVLPKQGLATNSQINNQATIAFDVNPPMSTQTWLNTIDNTPPTSQVSSLPSTEFSLGFPVSWTGTDIGAGIQDFTIYVSDNGGPFAAFMTNTTATSATFPGQRGHTYDFYSIARDLVGNVEAAKSAGEATTQVATDTTPPVTTVAASPGPNANGWNNANVTVTLNSTDNEPGGTGMKGITYAASGAQTIPSTIFGGASTSLVISAEGITTITFFGTDNAGNVETPKTLTIKLDKTPPIITPTRTPLPNANGWNNANVTVSFQCADSLSGLAAGSPPAPTTLSTEGGNQSVSGTCQDLAGNSASATVTGINIDKTPPAVACSANPSILWPPNNKLVPINVSVNVTDSLSGPAGFTLVSVTSNEPDSGQGDIQGFVAGTASTNGQLRAQRLGSGTGRVYTFTYSGSDRAGNTASCITTVNVPHDQGQH